MAKRIVCSFLLEHLLWLIPAAIFLFISVDGNQQNIESAAPHLRILFGLALGLSALRLLFPIGRSEQLVRLFYGVAFTTLILFYAVSLAGFSFWGRIPTLQIVLPYLQNFRPLIAVLQIPLWTICIIAPATILLCIAICSFVLKLSDWPKTIQANWTTPIQYTAIITCLIIATFSIGDIVTARYASQGEPLTLSLVPGAIAHTNRPVSSARTHEDISAIAARQSYVTSDIRPTRNIILLVGDALRPEQMSIFGAIRKTTPELERLMANEDLAHAGIITTSCADSFCGLISLSRSRYAHDVSRNDLTISDVLSAHKYKTRQILGGDHSNFYDIREWYGTPDDYWDGSRNESYANDDKDVLKQLQALPVWDGTAEFIQLHLMSAHALGSRDKKFEKWTPTFNYYKNPNFINIDESRRKRITNYYDNGMSQFDSYVGRAIDILGERGYLQDALVVITGDHGEMLGEHNLFSHANGVYTQVLEVPLFIFRFGHTGKAYDAARSAAQIDIAPTIIAELGLPVPARWNGKSLDQLDSRQYLFFEHREEFGLIDFSNQHERWKFWINRKTGQEYAFELNTDSNEKNNKITSIHPTLRTTWLDALAPSIASAKLR